jgi:hypothetical protein
MPDITHSIGGNVELLTDEKALAFLTSDLLARKFHVQSEAELQAAVYGVIRERRQSYGMIGREVPLTPSDRIDFLIPTRVDLEDAVHTMSVPEFADLIRKPRTGGLGIELKVDGSVAEVGRQLQRYAQSEQITTLMLVTTLRRHRTLNAATFNGKKVHVVRVVGGFL